MRRKFISKAKNQHFSQIALICEKSFFYSSPLSLSSITDFFELICFSKLLTQQHFLFSQSGGASHFCFLELTA